MLEYADYPLSAQQSVYQTRPFYPYQFELVQLHRDLPIQSE